MTKFLMFLLLSFVALSGVAEAKKYVIKKGENPSLIAKRELGSQASEKEVWHLAMKICEVNKISDSRKIKIGTELIIPVMKKEKKVKVVVVKTDKTKNFEEYIVKNGDSLWKIARRNLNKKANRKEMWNFINRTQELSGLSINGKLKIGMKLNIPVAKKRKNKIVVSKIKMYSEDSINRDPYKGTKIKALKLLGVISESVNKKQITMKFKGEFDGWNELKTGDKIKMVSGKNKVANFLVKFKPGYVIALKEYKVRMNGELLDKSVFLNIRCGNWLIFLGDPEVLQKEDIVFVPLTEKEIKSERKIPIIMPGLIGRAGCPVEHEPIIGVGVWANKLAQGRFAFGEYLLWLKEQVGISCNSEYSLGLGMFVSWEDGRSKLSDYRWDAWGIGPQIGVKRTWFVDSDDPNNPNSLFRQWQLKLRGIWEFQDGKNPFSGYEMDQNNFKLGLYGEYEHQFDRKWMGIITAEGWLTLGKDRSSSWSGDSPESRDTFALNLLGQYKFNNDWQVRFGGGPFYQNWDRLWGMRFLAEARWRETIMFGPYLSFFPFGLSNVYEGFSASDLTTVGGFVRVEFGPLLRSYDRKQRMEKIKQQDFKDFGLDCKNYKGKNKFEERRNVLFEKVEDGKSPHQVDGSDMA